MDDLYRNSIINFLVCNCYEQALEDGRDYYPLVGFFDKFDSVIETINRTNSLKVVFDDFSYMAWHRQSGGSHYAIEVTMARLKALKERYPWIECEV